MKNKLLLLSIIINAYGYSQEILWDKSFGGNASDILFEMTATPDNGFLLSGAVHSSESGNVKTLGFGNYDYSLWKLDSNGEMEWNKNIGGSDKDILKKVILTNDGGYMLFGTSYSKKSEIKLTENLGESDVWIIKLNAVGESEWQISIGGSGIDSFNTLAQNGNKEIIIGLSSESKKIFFEHSLLQSENHKLNLPYYGGSDAVLVSIDEKGKLNWYKNFGGKFSDELSSILLDNDKNIYIGINSNSDISDSKKTNNLGQNDIWLLKLDENQKEIWQNSYGGNLNDQLISIQNFKNQITLVTNSNSPSGNSKKTVNSDLGSIWVFGIDTNGMVTKETEIKDRKLTKATSAINLLDTELIIAGYTSADKNLNKSDFYLSSINSDLEIIWDKTIENNKTNILKNVIKLRDNSIVLAGTSNSNTMGERSKAYGNNDFWFLKLGNKNQIIEELPLIEAFPNPATDYINVVLGFEYEKGMLSMYDISGRQIISQVIKNKTIPLSLGSLPQGIYIIDVKTNTKSESIKIIKK